ncbi:MAG TPA: hypothetical protein VFM18_02260 [Methanosarcina sp.]|nr:hypothetical protein [Methanosarcina sp.]
MSVLKQEIQNDPKKMGYLNFLPDSPGHVADLLNAKTQSGLVPRYVNARTVLAELGLLGVSILEALRMASFTVPVVYWILPFVQMESGVDVGDPFSQQMIDYLVSTEKLTLEQGTALKNMAIQPMSRAEQLGLGVVTSADIINAMNGE